ncbi:MAG: hypothetical protein AN484_28820 [Aphanizomenon flos-aquae WA102]|uniref:Uncharacterized protein n=1 Tax=Aphanizomenon flos-aquae WA102 TaxID=1710896 RepID=A0A1B7W3H6_APHFL|nr:MAG: hypothetical protein AN484_28820 [Aphanizomenon flos-aquae WA102]
MFFLYETKINFVSLNSINIEVKKLHNVANREKNIIQPTYRKMKIYLYFIDFHFKKWDRVCYF